jgi:hypothetical protein
MPLLTERNVLAFGVFAAVVLGTIVVGTIVPAVLSRYWTFADV